MGSKPPALLICQLFSFINQSPRESKTRGCRQCSEGARDLALAAFYDNVTAWLRDKTCSST